MSRVRAVFFDIDDTLVDFDGAARLAFHTVFGKAADYQAWTLLTRSWHERFPGELTWEAMRIGRTSAFCEAIGLRRDPRVVEARRVALLERSYSLFPDVVGCLATLRRAGLCVGAITNSDPDHQRRKLRAVGLSDALDVVVASGQVGAAKPRRAIFDHACATLGVPAATAVHIGDRLDLDARAAVAAGLRGVWLDRRGLSDGRCDVPVVAGLDELPALIG